MPNAARQRLRSINRRTTERVKAFQAEVAAGTAGYADFTALKWQFPFLGYVPCTAGGVDFVLFQSHDDQVAWEYLWFGDDAYEKEIIEVWQDWCSSPGVVYDIGAFTGLMSVLAALAHDDNRVHLFEPVGRTLERASINLRANRVASQVTMHHAAASDEQGTATINLYRDENVLGTGNSVYDKGLPIAGVMTIDTVVVDDLLPDELPTVVKIDVEGHELAVLRGLSRTIARARPRMIVEVWEHTRPAVLALLEEWGYDCTPFETNLERRVLNYRCLPRP